MENNHTLGLYISYYLAKFDQEAYLNLGYGNQGQTHKKIGELLLVNPNTVKNWRDEFDPFFGHRAGWYQRQMSSSRIKVMQALENFNELQVRGIVKDILSGKIKEEPYEEEQLLSIASEVIKGEKQKIFILRGPTGKAAEMYFMDYHAKYSKPIGGKLIDCRDLGCGYDFKIKSKSIETFIEVKGLAEITGGILFTDKEWNTAIKAKENYILCIVKNILKVPQILFIKNPGAKLNPNKNIYTVLQINWSVTEKELLKIK